VKIVKPRHGWLNCNSKKINKCWDIVGKGNGHTLISSQKIISSPIYQLQAPKEKNMVTVTLRDISKDFRMNLSPQAKNPTR
jgi:hypothetical protein